MKPAQGNWLLAGLLRGLLMALLWWAVTEGRADAWGFGIPLILLATVLSLRLAPPGHYLVHPLGLLRFLAFFLWQSLWAGLDLARRTLHPGLPLSPGLVEVTLRVPRGMPRILLANSLNLVPGTLVVHLRGAQLTIHVLDRHSAVEEEVRLLEEYVARVFGRKGADWS